MNIKDKIIIDIKEKIVKILQNMGINDDSPIYEVPPSREMGDLAFPMFKYASILKKNPAVIASDVQKALQKNLLIEKTDVKGAYLNIFYNKNYIAKALLKEIIEKNDKFGIQDKNNNKIIIEFSSPNTNKPLHLGHCRNNVLGDSIARIFKSCGYDVIKLNLINDRGIHICKSMLAYQLFGNDTTPEKEGKKSDHLVGNFYVKYAKESEKDKTLEEKAQNMLKSWEEGNKEIINLWELMNKWAIDGIKETYKRMGIEFNQFEFESINYLYGKDIVESGLKNDVFYKNDDGSIWINNEDIGMDKKLVIRKDGTSVYITQDLGTAVKRHDNYQFTEMIYVVGSEQIYHFKTLFAILKKLGYDWADKCKHLSYGMVNLPQGKMKSREGTVVDADNLMDLLYEMSYEVLCEREKDSSKEIILNDKEKEDTANKISIAALKYYLLNFSTIKDIMFIPEQSISFDGNTGPYLQYTTARLNSLFNKNENELTSDYEFILDYNLNTDESNLLMQLLDYEAALIKAKELLSPLEICNYLYNLARLYNKFYHDNPVIKAEKEEAKVFRLFLSRATHIILKNGIDLLGFSPLEKM